MKKKELVVIGHRHNQKAVATKKKSPLGGKLAMKGDRKYDEKTIKKQLKKYKLKPKQEVKIINPINNNQAIVTIDRTGTTENKLVAVMQNKKATQQEKDAMLSAYLFERGKENASFLAELYVSKGNHTRETQAFKKQMRFDYEMFADAFLRFLSDTAKGIKKNQTLEQLILDLANRFESFSELLSKRIQNLTEDRLREKGYGIYVSKDGTVYDTRSEDIVDKVEQDVKDEKEQNHE